MIEGSRGPPHEGKKQKNPETNLMAARFRCRLRPLQKNKTPETNLMISRRSGAKKRKIPETNLMILGIAAGPRLGSGGHPSMPIGNGRDRLNEKKPRTDQRVWQSRRRPPSLIRLTRTKVKPMGNSNNQHPGPLTPCNPNTNQNGRSADWPDCAKLINSQCPHLHLETNL